jgi:hypothetical protein
MQGRYTTNKMQKDNWDKKRFISNYIDELDIGI